MKLQTTFYGRDLLFERDLPLQFRALPAGAQLTAATFTLTPVTGTGSGATLFEETLAPGRDVFGLQAEGQNSHLIVDLGARRTLKQIVATNVGTAGGANLQVDMGGLWLGLDKNAGIVTPDTTDPEALWPLDTGGILHLPNLASQRFRVTYLSGVTVDPEATSVTLQSYPSNLTLSLGTLGPIWFRNGDLRAAVTTPDFSDVLQAYLLRQKPEDGVYDLTFLLHSDTLARLKVDLTLDYRLEQSLLPPELDRIIYPYTYDGVPADAAAPLTMMVPANATLQTGAIAITHRFDESRIVHGPVAQVAAADQATISPAQSLAHAIQLDAAQTVDAIDLHVEALTEQATLSLTLQADAGGKPFGRMLWPEPVQMQLTRPEAGGAAWASAPLPAPFTFAAGQTYWLIANSAEGEAAWGLTPAGAQRPLQLTRDNALSWRAAIGAQGGSNLAGLYRLRATVDTYRQPILADVGGHRITFDRYNGLRERPLEIADWPELAEAGNAALADANAARATLQERAVNGDFARWTRLEASPRPEQATTLLRSEDVVYWAQAVAADAARVYCSVVPRPQDEQLQPGWIEIIANEREPFPAGRMPLPVLDNAMPFPAALALATMPGRDTVYALALNQAELVGGSPPWLYLLALAEGTADAQFVAQISPRLYDRNDVHLAPAPDGRALYAATRSSDLESDLTEFPSLIRLPATMGAETDVIDAADVMPLTTQSDGRWQGSDDRPHGVAVTPDGQRAYVATEEAILLADLQADAWTAGFLGRVAFPEKHETPPVLGGMALSRDGARLYLQTATAGRRGEAEAVVYTFTLYVLDTALLEVAAGRGQPLSAAVLQQKALGQVVIPGESGRGMRLFDAGTAPPAGRTTSSGIGGIGGNLFQMALTPDGASLLLVQMLSPAGRTPRLRLTTLDAHSLETQTTLRTEADFFAALAATPDSRRAFLSGITLSQPFVASMEVVELNRWAPDGWALTAGRAVPIYTAAAPRPGSGPSARLGTPDQATGLSQVFAVAGGETYELRFRAWAAAANATAELFWLDEGCGALDAVEVPIPPTAYAQELQPYLWRGLAPAGAQTAELRFRQPAGGYLLLDDVSLSVPDNAVANGDFAVAGAATEADGPTATVPQGWELTSDAVVDAATLTRPADGGIRLKAGPAGAVTLRQTLAVRAEEPYTLTVRAHPYGPLSPQGSATLTIEWSDSTAPPLTYELATERFDVSVYPGTVPAGATGAVVSITQPPDGVLHLDAVAWEQPDLVEIPVTILAETAGEVTVSKPQVTYEVGPRPEAGTPVAPIDEVPVGENEGDPAGCAPTPPEAVPPPPAGEPRPGTEKMDSEPASTTSTYCPCCERQQMLKTPRPFVNQRGMRGVKGTCPTCDILVSG